MTLSSQHYLVITALGADRPGIVNTITRHVSSCGCNIEDSRLAMLGEEFTFIMLLSGSWNAITLIGHKTQFLTCPFHRDWIGFDK